MITEAELLEHKWRVRDNGFYKLGVCITPNHSDVRYNCTWQVVIKDDQGLYLIRSACLSFDNVAHLERVIKWYIQRVVFDTKYPVLAKLLSKLKRTLKNWIL